MSHEQYGPVLSEADTSPYTHHTLYVGKKRLIEEAVCLHGNFHGEYLRYHKNSKIAMRSFYKEGMLHGPSTCFYDDGKIASESMFEEGKPQHATGYYKNGACQYVCAFKKGQLHGTQQFFYENGAKKCELVFDTGRLSEKALLYYPDQTLRREISLKQGKRDGLDLCYDQDGVIQFALEYKNGIFCKCQIEDTIATTYQLG